MNIGFLSIHNPFDRNSFSGTTYYAYQALQRLPGVQTTVLGRRYHSQEKLRDLVSKVLSKVSANRIKLPDRWHQKIFQSFLSDVESDLRRNKIDVVLCLLSSSLFS